MIRLTDHVAVDPNHVTAIEYAHFYAATRVLVSGEWVTVDLAVGDVMEKLGVTG